jgi:hypothetical protein
MALLSTLALTSRPSGSGVRMEYGLASMEFRLKLDYENIELRFT